MRGLTQFLQAAGASIVEQFAAAPIDQAECSLKALHMMLSAPQRGVRKVRELVRVGTTAMGIPLMGYPPQPVRLNRSRYATPDAAQSYAAARESCVKFFPCQHAVVR